MTLPNGHTGRVMILPEGYMPVLIPNSAHHHQHHPHGYPMSLPNPSPPAVPAAFSPPPQMQKQPKSAPIATATSALASQQTPPKKIPRPKNSFMEYRAEKQPLILKQYTGSSSKDLSRIIADMWNAEPAEIKAVYQRRAERGRMEHRVRFPDYKYAPVKGKRKVGAGGGGAGRVSQSAPGSRSGSAHASPIGSPTMSAMPSEKTQQTTPQSLSDHLWAAFRVDGVKQEAGGGHYGESPAGSPTFSAPSFSAPASPVYHGSIPDFLSMRSAPVSAASSAQGSPVREEMPWLGNPSFDQLFGNAPGMWVADPASGMTHMGASGGDPAMSAQLFGELAGFADFTVDDKPFPGDGTGMSGNGVPSEGGVDPAALFAAIARLGAVNEEDEAGMPFELEKPAFRGQSPSADFALSEWDFFAEAFHQQPEHNSYYMNHSNDQH
ncbi:hypothetical protein HK104_007056 [Borealophlyctis nickersoniae]|nr:hypothetical protein HK104_007056 [Borealophlyctis nickersoniae]